MLDKLCGAISFFLPAVFVDSFKNKPPSTQENATTLFCSEAPEMFCGLRNLTWLSIRMGGGEIMSEFSFNVSLCYLIIYLYA